MWLKGLSNRKYLEREGMGQSNIRPEYRLRRRNKEVKKERTELEIRIFGTFQRLVEHFYFHIEDLKTKNNCTISWSQSMLINYPSEIKRRIFNRVSEMGHGRT